MVKTAFGLILLIGALALAGCDSSPEAIGSEAAKSAQSPETDIALALAPAELEWIGQRIFQNECAGQFRCLVHWNDGEAFPSLGIGHFIWYPEGVDGRFVESFPQLVEFMVNHEALLPDWLRGLRPFDAPWPDKTSFEAVEAAPRVRALRQFLAETQGLQVAFIYQRAQKSLVRVVQAAPADQRQSLRARLQALVETPGGVYALMDYVNFKGEGLSSTERYRGEGWGLLQVLLAMPEEKGATALARFRAAAKQVLRRRVDNSDPQERQVRWLAGWLKRLDTYQEPS